MLRDQSSKIIDETVRKYTKEFFLNKLSQLTPLSNKKNKINFMVDRDARPLHLTKNVFFKKNIYEEIELKEFSILYIIINNLSIFQKKIELLSKLNLQTKICSEFLEEIIKLLSSNKFLLETNYFKEKFRKTKYSNLINDINTLVPSKFISEEKKSENEILLFFDEIVAQLKKFELNEKIDILEKKMIKNMSEETYRELLDLKKQANSG